MKRKIIALMTLIISLLLVSCGGDKKSNSTADDPVVTTSVATSETSSNRVTSTSSSDTENSSETPVSSSSESTVSETSKSTIASSEITSADEETVYNVLEYIAATAETGTAGSSLKCADAAAFLLDWSETNNLSASDIERLAKDYIEGVFDSAQFKEQMDATTSSAKEMLNGDAEETKKLLSDAGVTDSDFPWEKADMNAINSLKKAADSAAAGD